MEQGPCPYCLQTIPLNAKKCFQCHQWLKAGKWDINNPPVTFMLIAIVALITMKTIAYFGLRDFATKSLETYTKPEWKNDLQIISKKITKNGKRLFITGQIQNTSELDWNSVWITANFYNNKNDLIDTARDYIQVKKKQKHQFHVEFSSYDKSEPRLYDHYELVIDSASSY